MIEEMPFITKKEKSIKFLNFDSDNSIRGKTEKSRKLKKTKSTVSI